MSTAAVLAPTDVTAFIEAAQRGFTDYTTSTGHKLFKQDDDHLCVWCGAPTPGRPSNEGVFYCSEEHWREYVHLPEFIAWGEKVFEDGKAYTRMLEQWQETGRSFRERTSKIRSETVQLQFAVGDWLVEGATHGFLGSFGNCYKTAEALTGYSASSLYAFRYVASKVPACIRVCNLPWAVHQLLAPLKNVEDQKRILQLAAAKPLSVADVRKLVKGLPSNVVPKDVDEQRILWREDVSDAGRDGAMLHHRMNKWWSGMCHLNLIGKKVEEAWQFYLPRMSSEDRASAAEKLRAAAARLTALADRVETFQPPVENAEAVTA